MNVSLIARNEQYIRIYVFKQKEFCGLIGNIGWNYTNLLDISIVIRDTKEQCENKEKERKAHFDSVAMFNKQRHHGNVSWRFYMGIDYGWRV